MREVAPGFSYEPERTAIMVERTSEVLLSGPLPLINPTGGHKLDAAKQSPAVVQAKYRHDRRSNVGPE